MYPKIESKWLAYILSHQKELRVEEHAHLRDAINNDPSKKKQINYLEGFNFYKILIFNTFSGSEGGKLVSLPSSFTGGPRYMHERTQDAMTYVHHYVYSSPVHATQSGQKSLKLFILVNCLTIDMTS